MALCTVLLICVVVYVALDWLLHLPKVTNYRRKYVVITGCDGGFNKLLALRLDALGFNVFAGCANKIGKDALAEICSPHLKPALLDVTSGESVQNFLNFVKGHLPADTGIWALVNNASISGNIAPTELLTNEDYLKVLDVNLLGPVEMTRSFLTLIRKSRGRVVNLSSVNGRFGALFPPYSVSKSGIEALSNVLRQEVFRQGISVSTIDPGAIKISEEHADTVRTQKYLDKSEPETISLYGVDFVAKLKHIFLYFYENRTANVNTVIDAYIHAITARIPRTRYVIGWDAKVITQFLFHLPDFIADRLIRVALRFAT
ncbi:hypothetical protein RRG08_010659 [Elysia crispata]|uniref:Uncharacterized protein n=1 Tax=Elysia crispata TaxID=231223 RepID=A0AAE0Z1T0_9GAST|nr:hypothetical protein RRG08_010659 [Elysia crispata]